MKSRDRDFRYMAVSDLLAELERAAAAPRGGGGSLPGAEALCEVTSRALHDSCSDVVGLGVKCLTPLLRAVTPAQAAPVTKLLLDGLRDAEAERREMGMHGLKATFSELDAGPEAAALLRASMPALVGALQSGGTDATGPADLQAGPLELLHLALQRFAALVDPKLHDLLKDVVLGQLGDPRSAVRKRAVQAVGSLAAALHGSSLDGLCADLLSRLQGAASAPARRAFLQAVGAVAQSAGARAGSLAEAAPLCAVYCRGAGEGEDELQEAALQALEALVQRLPEGRALGVEADVTALCLTCVAHDPNYSYSDDEGEGGCSSAGSSSDGEDGSGSEMQEDDGWGSDGYEDDFSDDEDLSWKVRRAAARLLASSAAAQSGDDFARIYTAAVPALCARLKEREEGVKLEILQTLTQVVAQAGAEAGPERACVPSVRGLGAVAPQLPRRAGKAVREKSAAIKAAGFRLLRALAGAFPEQVSARGGRLYLAAVKAMLDSEPDTLLRLEALAFTSFCLANGVLAGFFENVEAVCKAAVATVSHRYHKLTVAGLQLVQSMAAAISGAKASAMKKAARKKVAAGLHATVSSRLREQDIDTEAKISSLQTMAVLVVQLGSHLSASELESGALLVVERMASDGTRIAAIQALQDMVDSPLRVQVPQKALPTVLEWLGTFLRKADRELKRSILALATSMVQQPGAGGVVEAIVPVSAPAAALLNDSDLYVAAAAMGLFTAVLGQGDSSPAARGAFAEAARPQALRLVQSPLLQGAPLRKLQELFAALSQSQADGTGYEPLVEGLTGQAERQAESKQVLVSVGKCVSAVCQAQGKAADLAASLLQGLGRKGGKQGREGQAMGKLYCLAELGASSDLSGVPGLDLGILEHFASPVEGVKAAASYALGRSALGNLPAFLPVLLKHMGGGGKLKYLLLLSVKEVVAGDGAVCLSEGDVRAVLEGLVGQSGAGEEAARNVVSECLGKLLISHPKLALPEVQNLLGSSTPLDRVVAASAFKHAFSAAGGDASSALKPGLQALFSLVVDEDCGVEIAALQAVTQGLSVSPGILQPLLAPRLPEVIGLCGFREELTREVILGPFKQVEDDGIPLRRAAFICLDSVLSSCEGCADVGSALAVVVEGISDPFDVLRCSALTLSDHYSVKLTSHRALRRIISLRGGPEAVVAALPQITEALKKTLGFKPKRDAVQQEIERVEEMKAGALNAALALRADRSVQEAPAFQEFLQEAMEAHPALAEKLGGTWPDRLAPSPAPAEAMDTST